MAPNFECVVSSLLCAEDNSIFEDNDYYGAVEDDEELNFNGLQERNHQNHYQNQRFHHDLDGLPLQSEECLAWMVERESQHLPASDYLERFFCGDLDLKARNEAIDWIEKVNSHFGFGPLCAYLAVNYLDRFLSAYRIPEGKVWVMQLLAVACVSLAAKMEETEVPLSIDLQIPAAKFIFEAKTIQRMEILVLSTLKWRMQAVTPFSFIDCFIHKIINEQFPPPRSAIVLSIQLISSTMKGIDFLEFRPSEMAAAAVILALEETGTIDAEKAVCALSQYVQKRSVVKCLDMIQGMTLISGSVKIAMSSDSVVPQSPTGTLDAACFSYKSDETIVGSCANSATSSPEAKRRKLNRPCEVEL